MISRAAYHRLFLARHAWYYCLLSKSVCSVHKAIDADCNVSRAYAVPGRKITSSRNETIRKGSMPRHVIAGRKKGSVKKAFETLRGALDEDSVVLLRRYTGIRTKCHDHKHATISIKETQTMQKTREQRTARGLAHTTNSDREY